MSTKLFNFKKANIHLHQHHKHFNNRLGRSGDGCGSLETGILHLRKEFSRPELYFLKETLPELIEVKNPLEYAAYCFLQSFFVEEHALVSNVFTDFYSPIFLDTKGEKIKAAESICYTAAVRFK
ncbi:MAG: hypothetical protein GF372_11715 [Candidatus Marinimicrobia bacterium]|nr:hypothetical protein [Candidatus Neomarinimicrobiota bacterium]